MRRKEWIWRDWQQAPSFVPGAGSLADQVLAARHAAAPQDAEGPEDEECIHDPYLFNEMQQAVDILAGVVSRHGRIFVHGDYDADGLTASSILHHYFQRYGLPLFLYIPDRLEEGYGLSTLGVQKAISWAADVVITVDCGSTSHAEIAQLEEAGIPTIMTDHHHCLETLPPARARINPRWPEESYPFHGLSGAGVAWKLVQALEQRLGGEDSVRSLLDLAAIGTLADIMPMRGENRVLVREGLRLLNNNPRPGLAALLALTEGNRPEGEREPVDTVTIGFRVAPRLNAAGRMGNTEPALTVLTTDSPVVAAAAAADLDALNTKRREEEDKLLSLALDQLLKDERTGLAPVLLAAGEGWHVGVLGIVAARLSQLFHRPALVLGGERNEAGELIYTGSGRSPASCPLLPILQRRASILDRFGGHAQAAGLQVRADRLEELRESLQNESYTEPEKLRCDLTLTAEALTLEALESLEALKPYGPGTEEPVFALRTCKLLRVQTVGREKEHLQLRLGVPGAPELQAILFSAGPLRSMLQPGMEVDVLGRLSKNTWRAVTSLRLRIEDIHLSPGAEILQQVPERLRTPEGWQKIFAVLYSALQEDLGMSKAILDPLWLGQALVPLFGAWPDVQLVERLLSVFVESDILKTNYWPTQTRRLSLARMSRPDGRPRLSQTRAFRELAGSGGPV